MDSLIEHWYAALHAEIGVVISTTKPDMTLQKLYQVRKAAGDPDLAQLSIVRSPVNPNELWIVKRRIPSEPSDET